MKSSVRTMALAAMTTALLCLAAQIAVPVGMTKMTMQTFAAALAGFLLGRRAALMAVGAYLLLGACGLPVFSGFTGGIGVMMGPTGGFLIGFLPMAALCAGTRGQKRAVRLGMGYAGLAVMLLMGAAGMALAAGFGYGQAMLTGVMPFLWKDILSVWGAEYLAGQIRRRLKGAF